ncbi:MAG: hypothetical protein JO057_14210 [Chloroflexi bacterium]|nr:hypothetical protein [Chloroflexota bacterium]
MVVAGPLPGGQCRLVQVFAQPYMYWVGMDTDPRTTPEALAEFNRFYSTTHVHEVLAAHPGFVSVSRFELVEQDPRGGEHNGPRWLAVYEAQDEAAALQYIKDNERPWLHRRKYSPWPPARRKAKTVWRMLWQQASAAEGATPRVATTGTTDDLPPAAGEARPDLATARTTGEVTSTGSSTQGGPDTVYLVGTNAVPKGDEFDGCLELYRAFAHPDPPGCPRYCGISAVAPPADDTVWRVMYRRITLE